MKTIYVTPSVQPLAPDTVRYVSKSGFIAMDVLEATEGHYSPYLFHMEPAQIAAILEKEQKEQIDILWKNCDDYQHKNIATVGLMKLYNKPEPNTKALAIVNWVEELWNLYYTKRANIVNMEEYSPDFSEHGELPFSYKDAIEEA